VLFVKRFERRADLLFPDGGCNAELYASSEAAR